MSRVRETIRQMVQGLIARAAAMGRGVAQWAAKEFRRTSNIVAVLSVVISLYVLFASRASESAQAKRLEQERIQRTQAELRELFRKKLDVHIDFAVTDPDMDRDAAIELSTLRSNIDSLLSTQAIALAESISGHVTSSDYREIALGLSTSGSYDDAIIYATKARGCANNVFQLMSADLLLASLSYITGDANKGRAQFENLITLIESAKLPRATKDSYLIQLYRGWSLQEYIEGNTEDADKLIARAKVAIDKIRSPTTKTNFEEYIRSVEERYHPQAAEEDESKMKKKSKGK